MSGYTQRPALPVTPAWNRACACRFLVGQVGVAVRSVAGQHISWPLYCLGEGQANCCDRSTGLGVVGCRCSKSLQLGVSSQPGRKPPTKSTEEAAGKQREQYTGLRPNSTRLCLQSSSNTNGNHSRLLRPSETQPRPHSRRGVWAPTRVRQAARLHPYRVHCVRTIARAFPPSPPPWPPDTTRTRDTRGNS